MLLRQDGESQIDAQLGLIGSPEDHCLYGGWLDSYPGSRRLNRRGHISRASGTTTAPATPPELQDNAFKYAAALDPKRLGANPRRS